MCLNVSRCRIQIEAIVAAVLPLAPGAAGAQTAGIVTPPPNVLLTNANGVPRGQTGRLERG
jgi:hypothetical protein